MAAVNRLEIYNGTVSTAATAYSTAVQLDNEACNFISWKKVDYTAGDTLDITIQHCPTNSSTATDWKDVVAFTQVTTTDATESKAVTSATIPNLFQFVRAKIVSVGSSVDYDALVELWFERA